MSRTILHTITLKKDFMDLENLLVVSAISKNTSAANATALGHGRSRQIQKGQLNLLDIIDLDGKIQFLKINPKHIYETNLSSAINALGIKENLKFLCDSCDIRYRDIALKMSGMLALAAEKMCRAYLSGTPIIIRYHNDGDGMSCAIALYRAFMHINGLGMCDGRAVTWIMSKEISYSKDALELDLSIARSYLSIEKPMLIMADMGTNLDSNDSIKKLSGQFDILWLDHHSKPAGFDSASSIYINPLDFNGTSSMSAGLICSMLANAVGTDANDIAQASLISDFSMYADSSNKRAHMIATVVDYLSAKLDNPNARPMAADGIIRDENKLIMIYNEVSEMFEKAIEIGSKIARKYAGMNNCSIYVVDFGKIAPELYGYPLPGRFTSRLHNIREQKNNGSTITVVYYKSYISIRVSRDISKATDLLGIIDRIRDASDGRFSGGGHMEAASIKAGDSGMDEALSLLLGYLGAAKL